MSMTVIVSLYLIIGLILALGVVKLRQVSLQNLLMGVVGTILGLVMGALASVPLGKLPSPYGSLLPVAVTLVTVLVGILLVSHQRSIMLHLLPFLTVSPSTSNGALTGEKPASSHVGGAEILVDTSVIIDGRIADIAKAGFVPGRLLVPRFVLAELQNIADSDDAMRRGRGRRGLEVLNNLQSTAGIEVEIIDKELPDIKEVDAKLVRLAKEWGTNVLTTDFNLNRVAQIEGVRVLNINELSNAIRPVVLPGEELSVQVVQVGKEKNQGVGYLPDGTMIVVENGDKLIGQEVMTEVTRVFQTVAGKMIFATPRKQDLRGRRTDKPNRPTQALEMSQLDAPEESPLPIKNDVSTPVPSGRSPQRKHRGNDSKAVEDRLISLNQDDSHHSSI